jgi:hypothetical protein
MFQPIETFLADFRGRKDQTIDEAGHAQFDRFVNWAEAHVEASEPFGRSVFLTVNHRR